MNGRPLMRPTSTRRSMAGVERVEGAQGTREIQPEVAGEVVERTHGHDHERHLVLGGYGGHRGYRPITASHAEHFRSALCRRDGGEPCVLAWLQHVHPDPTLTGRFGQPIEVSCRTPRSGIEDQVSGGVLDLSHGRRPFVRPVPRPAASFGALQASVDPPSAVAGVR